MGVNGTMMCGMWLRESMERNFVYTDEEIKKKKLIWINECFYDIKRW